MNKDAAFGKVGLQVFRVLVVFIPEEYDSIDDVASEKKRFI